MFFIYYLTTLVIMCVKHQVLVFSLKNIVGKAGNLQTHWMGRNKLLGVEDVLGQ